MRIKIFGEEFQGARAQLLCPLIAEQRRCKPNFAGPAGTPAAAVAPQPAAGWSQ